MNTARLADENARTVTLAEFNERLSRRYGAMKAVIREAAHIHRLGDVESSAD